MINIDTRLLPQVTPDQLFLLCHIVNFMNENRMCFPSNKKLIEQSGFSDSKILRIKNELVTRKIISVKQRFRPDGSQTSNLYKIETEFIGVFVTGKNMSILDTTPFTDEEGGVFTTEGGTPSRIKPLEVLPNLSINKNKVLDFENEFSTFEKITIDDSQSSKVNPFSVVAKLQSEKERKESCAKEKKEKKPNPTYEAFTVFCKTFEQLSGAAYPTDQKGHYIMSPKDAGGMVYLLRWLEKVDRNNDTNEALKVFLQAAWSLPDKWLKANFTPAILYGQANKVYTAYQTSSPEAKKKAYDDEVDRLLADYIQTLKQTQ
jgi:hypothetical protein